MSLSVKQHRLVCDYLIPAFVATFAGSVAQWVEENVRFKEPKLSGPWSFTGREYLREIVEAWNELGLKDLVAIMGTRTGKTRSIFAGIAFRVAQSAMRCLWVMPNTDGPNGAKSVSRTRIQPMIKASPATAIHIPKGKDRHLFKTLEMMINGSIINITGSGTDANLAGTPCDIVVKDEADKFILPAAPQLADQRTKEFSDFKRWTTTTPTIPEGYGWQELLKTDLRRRHGPCPKCGKGVVFAWSDRFTILPKVNVLKNNEPIPLAFVKWFSDAKREDGTWDYDRVIQTAHSECPHCKGHIHDHHKMEMDKKGRWVATKLGAPGYRGWHLPSMYSVSNETTFGQMAKRFLVAIASVEGVQDFVNSDLAEPYLHQGLSIDRKSLLRSQIEITSEWINTLSVDVQQNAPFFWAVARAWNGRDKSHGLEYRALDQWADLDEMQAEYNVVPTCVAIDSGFDQAGVYRQCAELTLPNRCELDQGVQGQLPECIGWIPVKAYGGKQLRPVKLDPKDETSKVYLPYWPRRGVDPFAGTEMAHTLQIEVLEFLSDVFEDTLERILNGRTGFEFTISDKMNTEEYHRHMSGRFRKEMPGDPRHYKWARRHGSFPDHLRFCEMLGLVLAQRLQLISFDSLQTKEGK